MSKFLDYFIEKKSYYAPNDKDANVNGVVERWIALDKDENEVYHAPTKRELLDIIKENYGKI